MSSEKDKVKENMEGEDISVNGNPDGAETGEEAPGDAAHPEEPEDTGADKPEAGDAADDASSAEETDDEKPEGPDEENAARDVRASIELAKKDAEIADLTDRYKRTMAEYENYRKRTEKEKEDIYSFAVRDLCAKLLPVLDNLERGVAAVPEESKEDPIAQGLDKICKQFIKALSDAGIEPIEAVGQPFDTNFHNAVMHVDDENFGENTVAEEFQKGYTYRGTVIRHSMVKVAN